jgi:peptide/nickel transport system ATP-binding protein
MPEISPSNLRGEKQRAVISMALSCFSGLLIADEPTRALDMITSEVVTTLVGMAGITRGWYSFSVTHYLPVGDLRL